MSWRFWKRKSDVPDVAMQLAMLREEIGYLRETPVLVDLPLANAPRPSAPRAHTGLVRPRAQTRRSRIANFTSRRDAAGGSFAEPVSASEKLKELHEAASAYITADEFGQQAVRDANHFVDVMVECAPELIAVVEAAEDVELRHGHVLTDARAALDEALS